jgi:hypothetical protein
MSTRERRVTLALKWKHLDNLDIEEIQDRFEETGHGSFTRSTIRNYLNEEPADAVLEQIEEEHANVRLQIAEREERMYQRARDAEATATKDEPIKRVVPQTRVCKADRGRFTMDRWEFLDPDDENWPEWAEEGDVIIRFIDDGQAVIEPGDEYPVQAFDGSPKYTTEFAGLKRDVDDPKQQAMARQEQSAHLEAKGEALGIYSTDINMTVDGDVDHSVELDSETAAAIREADLDE